MKTLDLLETSHGLYCDPFDRRYYINGKRVERAEFDAIKRDPRVTLDTFNTVNENGLQKFYCVARFHA